MPYVLTTSNPALEAAFAEAGGRGVELAERLDASRTRTTVATLDDMRGAIYPTVVAGATFESEQLAAFTQAWELPEAGGTIGPLPDGTVIAVAPVDEAPTPVVVVTRHPDYDNEYQAFDVDPRQQTIDIDMGRSDLSNSDTLLSWATSHLDEADELGNPQARAYVYDVIGEEVGRNADALDAEDQGVRDAGKALFVRLGLDWNDYIDEEDPA